MRIKPSFLVFRPLLRCRGEFFSIRFDCCRLSVYVLKFIYPAFYLNLNGMKVFWLRNYVVLIGLYSSMLFSLFFGIFISSWEFIKAFVDFSIFLLFVTSLRFCVVCFSLSIIHLVSILINC